MALPTGMELAETLRWVIYYVDTSIPILSAHIVIVDWL
jgi:hypothetical protein